MWADIHLSRDHKSSKSPSKFRERVHLIVQVTSEVSGRSFNIHSETIRKATKIPVNITLYLPFCSATCVTNPLPSTALLKFSSTKSSMSLCVSHVLVPTCGSSTTFSFPINPG